MENVEVRNTPLDLYIVALDETSYWCFENLAEKSGISIDRLKKIIKKISGVYIFDRNTVIHCCSFSGSYWFQFIHNSVIFNDATDEEIEAVENEVMCEYTDNSYYDQSNVEKIIEQGIEGENLYHYGNPFEDNKELEQEFFEERSVESDFYSVMDKAIEPVIDWFRSNPKF